MFKIVGPPKSAIRLVLEAGKTAKVNSSILALNTAQFKIHEGLVTGPCDVLVDGREPITLRGDEWTLSRQYVVAQSTEQSILSATSGIFRVDVPQGHSFVVNPSSLVGYNAGAPSVVYGQGRLDVLASWLAVAREQLGSVFRAVKGLWSRGVKMIRPELPESDHTTPDPAYFIYWHKAKTNTQTWWSWLQAKTFKLTHPEQLQFSGPCSILIKG